MSEHIPTVAVAITQSRDCRDPYWILEITCPYCGRRHLHGGGPVTGPPVLGARVSHCAGHAEYELVEREAGRSS